MRNSRPIACSAWIALLLLASPVVAQDVEQRARAIGHELRCLICQNQSIEDSEADIAKDLRRLLRERLAAGDSDRQVVEFIHARYGDFVLLRPPFKPVTAVLWGLPVLVLLGGAFAMWRLRRRPAAPVPLSEAERKRLAMLEAGEGR